MIEAGDQSKLHRVCANSEYNGNGRGGSLGRKGGGRCINRGDYVHSLATEFSRQSRQSFVAVVGPAVFDYQVFALDIADLAKPFTKSEHQARVGLCRGGMKKSNHRSRRLLRARRERPRRRTAKQSNELAPPHELALDEGYNLGHHLATRAPVHRDGIFLLMSLQGQPRSPPPGVFCQLPPAADMQPAVGASSSCR